MAGLGHCGGGGGDDGITSPTSSSSSLLPIPISVSPPNQLPLVTDIEKRGFLRLEEEARMIVFPPSLSCFSDHANVVGTKRRGL